MTILCITTTGLPGIRRCTYRGRHGILCPDRDVNRAIYEHQHGEAPAESCGGCAPRLAERGYLCQWCFEKVEAAYFRWREFRQLVLETGGRAVSVDGGGVKGAAPEGFTNLPLTFLALDECDRLLRSLSGKTLELWVHSEAGARDAIMFAHAADRAYRALEVESRPLQLERVRCPHCGLLSLSQNPTRQKHGAVIVECQHCGELLDKIRDDTKRWVGTESCETGDHAECRSLHCRCDCHTLGDGRTVGAAALWDADVHRVHPSSAPRGDWAIDGRTIHPITDERKTA